MTEFRPVSGIAKSEFRLVGGVAKSIILLYVGSSVDTSRFMVLPLIIKYSFMNVYCTLSYTTDQGIHCVNNNVINTPEIIKSFWVIRRWPFIFVKSKISFDIFVNLCLGMVHRLYSVLSEVSLKTSGENV